MKLRIVLLSSYPEVSFYYSFRTFLHKKAVPTVVQRSPAGIVETSKKDFENIEIVFFIFVETRKHPKPHLALHKDHHTTVCVGLFCCILLSLL